MVADVWRKKAHGATIAACLLLGCASHSLGPAASPGVDPATTSWLSATVHGRGDCGVPVLHFDQPMHPYGVNAIGIPSAFLPVEGRPVRIQVVLGQLDAADPRTQVTCTALGPGRGWVLVVQSRWPPHRNGGAVRIQERSLTVVAHGHAQPSRSVPRTPDESLFHVASGEPQPSQPQKNGWRR